MTATMAAMNIRMHITAVAVAALGLGSLEFPTISGAEVVPVTEAAVLTVRLLTTVWEFYDLVLVICTSIIL